MPMLLTLLLTAFVAEGKPLFLTTSEVTLNLPGDHEASSKYDQISRDLTVKLMNARRDEANAPIEPDGLLVALTHLNYRPEYADGVHTYTHRQTGLWLGHEVSLNALEVKWASLDLKQENGLSIATVIFTPDQFVSLPRGKNERSFGLASSVVRDVNEFADGFDVEVETLGATLRFSGVRTVDGRDDVESFDLNRFQLRRFLAPGRGQAMAEWKITCARLLGALKIGGPR